MLENPELSPEDKEKLYDIIIKSLSLAPLNLEDVMTLSLVSNSSFLVDYYGLNYSEAVIVKNHLQGEILRLNAQVSSYRRGDEKFVPSGHKCGSPGLGRSPQIKESKNTLSRKMYRMSEGSLRKFVRRIIAKKAK